MLRRRTTLFDCLCGFVLAGVGLVFTPGIISAASLSGTVQYTGTQGPVSSTRPILVFLWTTPSPTSDPVVQIAVATNGPFDLAVPAEGTYYLGYVLDLNDDGRASVGESFQVYRNRPNFPGDPIVVPKSGVTLSFDDAAALSGIAGIVSYTGRLGPVSNQRRLIVQAFRDAALADEATDSEHQKTNSSRYDLVTLDTNAYYVRAFLDVNGNRQFEPGEPFTVYNDRGAPPFDPVVAGPHQTAIDIAFGDENISGMPTPTPTPTHGSCVGDCNGDGQVTVNDLIQMVNVALGNAAVSTCTAGNPNSDGEITVNEIVAAVNNALNRCS